MTTPIPTPPLTCREIVQLVTDYLEGALPPAEREAFERHLDACDGCRAYLEQMRETVRLTGAIELPAEGTPLRDELLRAFRAWKQSRGV